jgi:BlaI family transcriptional regulator, penicillinase repressor
MKPLTKAEEQVMQAVWSLKDGGMLKDIVEAMPEPRPHHNTVATVLKILADKKFIGIKAFGRFNHYYARIGKDEFTEITLNGLTRGYFEGSYPEMVSFMVDQKKISVQDLELLLKQLKSGKK